MISCLCRRVKIEHDVDFDEVFKDRNDLKTRMTDAQYRKILIDPISETPFFDLKDWSPYVPRNMIKSCDSDSTDYKSKLEEQKVLHVIPNIVLILTNMTTTTTILSKMVALVPAIIIMRHRM